MKNKIAFKLTMYFSTALVLFSVIIGILFTFLFTNYTMSLQKKALQERAVKMATTLSEFMTPSNRSMGMMGGRQGYGAYMRFLDDIAMTDVWIVDQELNIMTTAQMSQHGNNSNAVYSYNNLPENAEAVVNEVFEGKSTFSEGFSSVLEAKTLTIGTPILSEGNVMGALLLHTQVSGLNESILLGLKILAISIFFALIIAVILSIFFAISFTKPLKTMKNTALQLVSGNYSVQTHVVQNDEIGELASTIDVLSKRLEAASYESEKLLKLRRDFIANISHELRTPVTVIRGSLEALCDEVVTDPLKVKEYHAQMLSESIFLQRLVNDLLDLSRLQNTDFNIEMQPVNLCDVLQDVVRSASHMAQNKNIIIEYEQDKDFYDLIGDYGRLRQMFMIIVDNSIKFSNPCQKVSIRVQNNTVSIKDSGVGIAKQDLPYIFDRFYKVKSEQNKQGSGLGLAIAKQIADRHNIKLTVNSTEGTGTEFIFYFEECL